MNHKKNIFFFVLIFNVVSNVRAESVLDSVVQLISPALRWDWSTIDLFRPDFFESLNFPKDFKFGVATSAYQIEGPYFNGTVAPDSWVVWQEDPTHIEDGQKVGTACQHCTYYKEDIQRIKECGFTRYRFSILWSKLEPQQGVFDEAVMHYYEDLVDELLRNGIEPIVMLFHHAWPLWFEEQGGFENAENIGDFVEFAQFVFKRLYPKVKVWMTINEPSGYALEGFYRGHYPPGKHNLTLAGIVLQNFLDAHVAVYQTYKKYAADDPELQIGLAHAVHPLDPYHAWHPLEKAAAYCFDYLMNDVVINYFRTGEFWWGFPRWTLVHSYNEFAQDSLDFIGVNYYSHTTIKMFYRCNNLLAPAHHKEEVVTEKGNVVYPEGLYRAIQRCAKLNKPLYITENGVADKEDTLKDVFIRKHLYAVSKALQEGYDIRSYDYWTLMDNWEWHNGYNQGFGLYHVDFNTQKRTLRDGTKPFIKFVQERKKRSQLL